MSEAETPAVDTIVLATGNPGKVTEMRAILAGLGYRLLTPADLSESFDIVEDAQTLEGNARKKAESVARRVGMPAVADDTGLEVTALGGEPGVRSARYAGPDCNAARNRQKLLDALTGVADRRARFRTVIAFTVAGQTRLFEGVCDGTIARAESGAGGFGYDAIFVPSGSELTFAEMTAAEKNRISHRAHALESFKRYVKESGLT